MLRAVRLEGDRWHEVEDVASISDLITQPDTVLWAFADVAEFDEDITTIAEEFSLDPLAVEDATRLRQRPKLEQYANHLFAVMHQLDEVDGQYEAHQMSCFIGRGWVLTLHDGCQRTITEASKRLVNDNVEGRAAGIMHVLLDTIVDDYERLADDLEEQTETIEGRVLTDPTAPVQRELYSLKQRLSRLRRYAGAGERVLGSFVTRQAAADEALRARFRDVHDHTQRILEQADNVNAILGAVLDLQRSAQANALNETTKRLTGWAAIIAVPTLIASIYGMNFELVPRSGHIEGFYFALSLMIASGVGLYVYFKRRTWI